MRRHEARYLRAIACVSYLTVHMLSFHSAGEQPIKGLVSPVAQARMTVVEALSNVVFADITALSDVKASCNWMWPAKLTETQVLYVCTKCSTK
jgi:phosphoribosylformylglycinamidine (FGAM) synthase-like enzyme